MTFAKDFVWGAAAAAYQIEGTAHEDGRGLSVWDVFCRKPGAILTGDTGDVACDHYHRYKEDVGLMKEIGLGAYRFSISWPRVLPAGTGEVNAKGLAFYDKLVDELLSSGIEPYVTLFHWDFPYELYLRGGWLNREVADWFAEYVQVVVDKLGDRVRNWMTLCEVQCFIGLGLMDGLHAPGLRLDLPDVLLAGHNALLAHGKAVQVIRARSKDQCKIGWAPVGVVHTPATQSRADIEACRRAMFSIKATSRQANGCFAIEKSNCRNNTWWMDPIFFGRYPEDGLEVYGDTVPKAKAGDMETISQPLDFFGVNCYFGPRTRMGKDGQPEDLPEPVGAPRTTMDWAVNPDILYWGPKFFYERYKSAIIMTENGMANTDWVTLDGKVHDPQRIDYLQRHLLALRKAGENGVDIRGYFLWSIMDNFEWWHGYTQRFGIIYIDYETQRRTLKDSARWYKDVIASNGKVLSKDLNG